METQNLILQWIVVVFTGLLLLGSVTWFGAPVCPECSTYNYTCPETPSVNLTSVEAGMADIQATLDEEDDWKDEAVELATEEWKENDYKDLFKWMSNPVEGNLSIDDRDDIEKVVIKDTRYFNMDADDKYGVVEQDLKVYYEDKDGDNKKVYITVETTIEESEVEEQTFVI